MSKKKLNLFIIDDNELLVCSLERFLIEKFGSDLTITVFSRIDEALSEISETTDVVILDCFLEDTSDGLKALEIIKQINPMTEVIMLSNNQDIALAIDSFRMGVKDYVVKGHGSWRKISKLVENIIKAPIRFLVKEFRVSKYMAVFLLTFLTMCAVVLITLSLL